ncbi:MAG: hypothetical protein A2X83_00640 [Desulfuromonadales bacterium GWD2_54_10]|nr:MAG: hypothetical protein A2X83_00640 [Desulfuromonadales bacterium GWD2_54_10]
MIPSKDELALAIDEAEWSWLRAHLGRGGLILVDDSLDLAEAAHKVAGDEADLIEQWVRSGKLGRPSESQMNHWDNENHKKFAMLIVSPYVLIQEKTPTYH